MAKDFDSMGDINPENRSAVGGDNGSDFGGDLASDDGVDLNASEGQQEAPAKLDAGGLSVSKDRSLGERLGATMGALGALASPYSQYAQMENMNGQDAPVDCAIYQEYNNPNQQIDAELAQFAQLQELENRRQNSEASELDSALNEPVAAGSCDSPLADLDTEEDS